MNPIRRLRRVAGVLAGLACAWLGLAVAAPAAFAIGPPAPPLPIREKHPPLPAHAHTVVIGMPGWQIALIAIGAALVAAVLAVLLDRARATRRHITAPAA